MERIPMEWIDKLFVCMAQFYGERWTKQFTMTHSEAFAKTMWQSALTGVGHDEIKKALLLLKRAAEEPGSVPPHQLEFYRYTSGDSIPLVTYYQPKSMQRGCEEVANTHLHNIKKRLGCPT